MKKLHEQQITTVEEKYLQVNQQLGKLKMFSNAKEMEDQLSSMQRKIINVKSAIGSVDVKIKYIEEVASPVI